MSLIVVDVESDGPAVGLYSMVCFGAVLVPDGPYKKDERTTFITFSGKTAPISESYIEEALSISGYTRKEHEQFPDPEPIMTDFFDWILWTHEHRTDRPTFISDNLAFDWQFINYYLHRYCGRNPFGWSGRRIGDLWTGFQSAKGKPKSGWKHLRDTKHTHDPEDDALGNAEALLKMREMGINI